MVLSTKDDVYAGLFTFTYEYQYDGVTLYYNPDGEPELPEDYLGIGA